ncbi:chaperone TorD involved in molybdoenzyme TorA maturation [Kosakonia oryzendophytica]|uniref:Tat proofreading chaperone DmsD n=1 Tax=Kosakonia oryzendophytica TaxID=1005665 RepID=A0A1C4CXV5_9ENTR|nr:Tat proofreading chaperone DmsD [Kosakonia oryzendophytica]SCC23881.1 chaperone TorD involved in molybdoenzyme TorA maturation [Kosakonia oryzendophytica]
MTDDTREAFIFTARVLGALFYYPPDSEPAAPLIAAFKQDDWVEQWPLPQAVLQPLVAAFTTTSDEPLQDAWQRLLIGPHALPAPPWGSVWLDKESVLFGDSTLALRQWMRENSVVFDSTQNEPEDHFGALLLLAAWLAEQGNRVACDQLLAWHLLPWAGRFLTVFSDEARHPFWHALGLLAQLTLADWQSRLLIPVAQKPLFR